MWVESALAAILCSWLGSLWIKLLLWGGWRKTVKWIILDGHGCIWEMCSTSRVWWFSCALESRLAGVTIMQRLGECGNGLPFLPRGALKSLNPDPHATKSQNFSNWKRPMKDYQVQLPAPHLTLSDRTESVVQTDPLAKTSPATNTWSCSGCKTCPCVLQHLKPLTNLF